MNFPLEITFRHMEPSPALEQHIRGEVSKLQEFSSDILHCHVTVDAPHLHCQHGHDYHIGVFIRLPDHDIVVNHAPSPHSALVQEGVVQMRKELEPEPVHKDPYLAVGHAFSAARRQIQDYNDQIRDRRRQAAETADTL
jgi:ribosome-associated translation inhibitor RaiA